MPFKILKVFAFRTCDSLVAFHLGVLGDLSWKENLDSGLNVGSGHSFLVSSNQQTRRFSTNLLHDVVDHSVDDVHSVRVNLHIGVNRLENFEDKAVVTAI